jgi:DNA-binding transcriptional MocR family regulator
VGWIEGSPGTISRLNDWAVVASGGSICQFSSCVVASALELGLVEQQLASLKTIYAARAQALVAVLQEELGDVEGCSYNAPSGGYFVWLQLPFEAEHLKAVEAAHGMATSAGHYLLVNSLSSPRHYLTSPHDVLKSTLHVWHLPLVGIS